jgi:hypothetical protein
MAVTPSPDEIEMPTQYPFKRIPVVGEAVDPQDLEEATTPLKKKTYTVTPSDPLGSTPFETDNLVFFILFLQTDADFSVPGAWGLGVQAQALDDSWFYIANALMYNPNSQGMVTPSVSWSQTSAGYDWPQGMNVKFPFNIRLGLRGEVTAGSCLASLYYL